MQEPSTTRRGEQRNLWCRSTKKLFFGSKLDTCPYSH
ncbi:hypothetical protein HU200_028628 [Digitaria exilis]|uniref:Uncharacterized protein n=1 Tax=Digitaria exilis TaxID=1010633 RepID=A0A835BVP4_9POAL|nr:hypothetical protein HU200_028628 [Digitaria exilis]